MMTDDGICSSLGYKYETNAVAKMLPSATTMSLFCVSARIIATTAPVIDAIVFDVAKNIAGKIIAPNTE